MLNSEECYCQTGGRIDNWKREGSRNQLTGEGAEEQKEDMGGEIRTQTRTYTQQAKYAKNDSASNEPHTQVGVCAARNLKVTSSELHPCMGRDPGPTPNPRIQQSKGMPFP